MDYVQLSQDYNLPRVVKTALDAAVQQANAIAIVMGLFAGALVSFAQIVSGVDENKIDKHSIAWGALLIFLYGAIMLSLGGSFLSLIIIKMCSDLPLAAQQRVLTEQFSSSTKLLSEVARGRQTIPAYILESHFRLLENFGMAPEYRMVHVVSGLVLISACVCTFIALTLWVFISEAIITAGITMVFFVLIAFIVIMVYFFASNGQGWR